MATRKNQPADISNNFIKTIVSRENMEAILIAIVLALFIRSFVVQAFKIPSGSMEPTLLIGDHILVNKFIYGLTIPFTDKKLRILPGRKRLAATSWRHTAGRSPS